MSFHELAQSQKLKYVNKTGKRKHVHKSTHRPDYLDSSDESLPKYTNLVLEGGGVLGIAYCGALEALHKLNLLSEINNFAGASAGSIVAGLLACGASFNFLQKTLSEMDFRKFLDYGYKISIPVNLFYHMGACKGNYFESWYGDQIETLTSNRDITLLEIYEKYGTTVVITAADLNTRSTVFLRHETHPNISLVRAVRCSMSVEGIFMPVKVLKDDMSIVNNVDATNNEINDGTTDASKLPYLFVDGGTMCNYPIESFHIKDREGGLICNEQTIGLMLITDEEQRVSQVTGLVSYIGALLDCLLTRVQKEYMDPSDWQRTIKIKCGAINAFDFDIDDKQKISLVENGRKAVNKHFTKIAKPQHRYFNDRKNKRIKKQFVVNDLK